MEQGKHTWHEIGSQPTVWTDALRVFTDNKADFDELSKSITFDSVVVTGCGSTHYLSMVGARLLRKSGLDAQAYPASELLLYPDAIYLPDKQYLMLAVSRSGTTSETVRAVENFKRNVDGVVLTVTCDSDSTLAQLADFGIAINSAQEESVAQTRSFSSMAVVLQQMAGALAGHNLADSESLPAVCQTLLDTYADLAKSLGKNPQLKKFFFLGSDALYGIASEAMLKMKEMSLAYSEAFHMMEFRHGPMSMVADDSLVVGLITPSSSEQEIQVLQEMQKMGAIILAIAQTDTDFDHHIMIPSDIPVWATPILYLPILQLIGYHRSLFNGQNPDQPHNLTAVISLDNL